MNAKDRYLINSNIELLSQLIDLKPIIPLLRNKNIFTKLMIDDILEIEPEMNRKQCFLKDLTRRGPEAFEAFVEILYGTDQIKAARILKPQSLENGLTEEEVVKNLVQSPPPDWGGGDEPSHVGNTIASLENDELMLRVQQCREPMIGPNYYRMSSNPRGICLIINNMDFINDVYSKRKGSEVEAIRLRDVFQELHFTVELMQNLPKEDILKTIKEYSKLPDLRKHDALVLIVLSHGHSGYVVGSDGVSLQFEDIVVLLNNENCPQLINKPKLFFFNCCRGDNRDLGPKFLGLEIDKNAVTDAKTFKPPKVPLASDIMICYSTVDGYVSWRNEETGSWFGTSLSHALMKHSCDKELHHILTNVSEMVNNKVTEGGEKQVMEYLFRGWKKIFYFNPGYTSND